MAEPDGADLSARAEAMLERIGRNEHLSALLSIWIAAGDGGLPKRTAIDPVDLAAAGVMPYLLLMERTEEGIFRYRLAGERTREALRTRVAGRTIHQVFSGAVANLVHARYVRIIGEGCVEYSTGDFFRRENQYHTAERLILPVANEDGDPAFAIGLMQITALKRFADPGADHEANYDFFDVLPWQYLAPDGVARR